MLFSGGQRERERGWRKLKREIYVCVYILMYAGHFTITHTHTLTLHGSEVAPHRAPIPPDRWRSALLYSYILIGLSARLCWCHSRLQAASVNPVTVCCISLLLFTITDFLSPRVCKNVWHRAVILFSMHEYDVGASVFTSHTHFPLSDLYILWFTACFF